ncbi:MAG: SpoIIE family protein phosphatase [Roseovarius sp.]|nr:SpoIIE family protein phosphatase [Roseovarius sp.]MCY4209367.1 SpoIIE family protein phosphatase [Roseovarius sp.]MCY4291880.1 SpoIIE family protein phosphatase [Roseovarius sp.]MCY4316756.1 SpoIIE family protein phosphatase [Roseovarius sp.]
MEHSDLVKTILVVDDEPALKELVRQRMRRDIRNGKYEFVFAENGVEALECLKNGHKIDMILSDINMPEMDGLTLLREIPKVDPDVRSVVVSAYGDIKNIRTAMNFGAFDFLIKPIDFDDLRRTIDRTLEHLELWRSALEARDKLVVIENELNVANRMQKSILPTNFPSADDYHVFAKMEPARDVGGDFYDVVNLPDGRIVLTVADVSGKGVPAALFMMCTRTCLRTALKVNTDPVEIMRQVNNVLCENNDEAMFVTIFLSIYDPSTRMLEFVNGGHNPPIRIGNDNVSDKLSEIQGVALGVAPDMEYTKEAVELSGGETVLFYTDGVNEAENNAAEQFGMNRLETLFAEKPTKDAREITENIFKAINSFADGAPQFDDITCLTLCCMGKSEMTMPLSLNMEKIEDLHDICDSIEAFSEKEDWDARFTFQIQLIIEELAKNALDHGNSSGGVKIGMTSEDNRVLIEYSDAGNPFNPFDDGDAPDPDTDSNIEDRNIGGLGVHLVKTLIDEAKYKRMEGRNHLTMIKNRSG